MNRIQSPWLIALLSIILVNVSFVTQARILSVQGSNSPTQLGLTSNGRSQITWAVVEQLNAAGQAQISSSDGQFYDAEQKILLGSSPRFLNQTRSLNPDMNTTFIFQETLIIPQSVIRNAQSLGLNQIIYVRTFQDNPGATSLSNLVTFSISASASVGNISLRQIQLEFDDNRTSAIIQSKSQLKANAIVSFQGTGLIEYRWEIASPPSTNGQPVFIPLNTRREYLLSSGQETLSSPALPTSITGTYLLRLNIVRPNPEFEMPMLRYFVRANDQLSQELQVQTMSVSAPPINTKLTLKTQFIWQPIQGAKAYQVEIYDRPMRNELAIAEQKERPLTGVIVPASQTSLIMRQISTNHLNIGATYYWRVIAISDNGNKIGTSEFRSINY